MTQRQQYKNDLLSPERILKLNEIGFVWDPFEAQWLESFEELKKYKNPNYILPNNLLLTWLMSSGNITKQQELDANEVEKIMPLIATTVSNSIDF
jgi:hypothetical protein